MRLFPILALVLIPSCSAIEYAGEKMNDALEVAVDATPTATGAGIGAALGNVPGAILGAIIGFFIGDSTEAKVIIEELEAEIAEIDDKNIAAKEEASAVHIDEVSELKTDNALLKAAVEEADRVKTATDVGLKLLDNIPLIGGISIAVLLLFTLIPSPLRNMRKRTKGGTSQEAK